VSFGAELIHDRVEDSKRRPPLDSATRCLKLLSVQETKLTGSPEQSAQLIWLNEVSKVDQCPGWRGREDPVDLADVIRMQVRHMVDDDPIRRIERHSGIVRAPNDRYVYLLRIGHGARLPRNQSRINTEPRRMFAP